MRQTPPPRAILFQNVTALLMDNARTVLRNACVTVADGIITTVSPQRPEGTFDRVIDGHGGILMPGLVNCHTHIAMTAMRGYGDGNNLQTWLNDYIWPVERRWDDRSIRVCADLGLMEMIASGTTCVCDMYMRTETIGQALLDSGISGHLSVGGVYFGENSAFDPAQCHDCAAQEDLVKVWHNADDGRIRFDASLHAEYTSTPALWEWTADFAKRYGLNMHVHISETFSEHQECKIRWGLTPIRALDRYGVWDGAERSIAAHCVWCEPEDWSVMLEKRVSAVHNPASNLKLGSGIAPIKDMMGRGVNITLGTDGVSSNNSTDLFEEMKLAVLLQNGLRRDPQALAAWDALEMATVNGAGALGRNTGRIEAGRDADLILLDPDAPNLIPCHSAAQNAVYSACGSNVILNMCRGNIIYENGTFLTIDAEKTLAEVRSYALPLLFG